MVENLGLHCRVADSKLLLLTLRVWSLIYLPAQNILVEVNIVSYMPT